MRKQASGWSALSKTVRTGVRKSLQNESPFVLAPVNWVAKKIFGEKKVRQAYWKYFQKPLVKADINLGAVARKGVKAVTGGRGGSLFEEKKLLNMAKSKGLSTGKQEYTLPSIMAPASKAGKFIIPLAGAMKLEEMLKGRKKVSNQPKIKTEDLRKTAEMLENLNQESTLLKKEAKATELLYKQAEMGSIKFPKTFAEYQEKVAELLGKDLNIVEEAIGMAASSEGNVLGDIGVDSAHNAQDAFQKAILN